MRSTSMLLASALALPLVGCGTTGKLGEAFFDYECVNDSDTHCDIFGDFPEALAVDSRFRVSARRTDGSGSLFVTPAAAAKLGAVDGSLVVRDEGPMSILALEGTTVVDILDLRALPVAELSIAPSTGDTSFTPPLSLGLDDSATQVVVRPLSSLGGVLGGALSYTWEVSPEGIVDLSPINGDNAAMLTPQSAGQATLTVRQGTVERTLEVVVEAM